MQIYGGLRPMETERHALPPELGRLAKLQVLNLNDTKSLTQILPQSFTGLSNLQVLTMNDCAHKWGRSDHQEPQLTIEDLRNMKSIQHLWLTVRSPETLQLAVRHHSLTLSGPSLQGNDFTSQHLQLAFTGLSRLQWVQLNNIARVDEVVVGRKQLLQLQELELVLLGATKIRPEVPGQPFLPNLRHVGIYGCDSLTDLDWLSKLPKLELLCIQNCKMLARLVSSGHGSTMDEDPVFPNLQFLLLFTLPAFVRFSSSHPLLLPSLRTLKVKECSNLARLPFGNDSCLGIKDVKGSREWWDGLQWDSDEIRSRFLAFFQPL